MSNFKKSLSRKKREDGKQQIMLQVTVSRTCRPRIKSGVFVNPSSFDGKKGEIIVPRRSRLNTALWEEANASLRELNEEINIIERIIAAAYGHIDDLKSDWIEGVRSFLKEGKLIIPNRAGDVVNWDSIQEAFSRFGASETEEKASSPGKQKEEGGKPKFETLSQVIAFYVEHHKQAKTKEDMSPTRRTQFMTLCRLIERFELYTQMTGKSSYCFDYNTCNQFDLEALRKYLLKEGSLAKARPKLFEKILAKAPLSLNPRQKRTLTDRGTNYMAKLMKNLKCLFAWMLENGITANEPFKKFDTGEQVYGRPIYISIEERNRIADADLSGESETLQEQRDIFVFQCQTGCRVSDLLRLTPGNVQNGILEYVPSKTSHGSSSARPRVPLTPRAMSIVEKYRDNKSCRGRLLPFISSQQYNQMIKEIFKIAGVTRKVNWRNPRSGMYELRPINEIASSHMARRTFVGNAYKMTKDPALIGYMSGHTPNSRSFQRYRDIDDDDLKEVIGKIE